MQSQLEKLNDNLTFQEENIKQSIKKSQAERTNGPSSLPVIPPAPPYVAPPRPPYPDPVSIPVKIEKSDKKVAINPSPNYLNGHQSNKSWFTDERIYIVKKTKNDGLLQPRQQNLRNKRISKLKKPANKITTTDSASSDEDGTSTTSSFSHRINQQFQKLVADSTAKSSGGSYNYNSLSRPSSRLSNYQPYSFKGKISE